jgi:hypothetical protein
LLIDIRNAQGTLTKELKTLSWAEAVIYWDCLETTSDFPEQWIHVAVDSCQDRVSKFIDDKYKFLLKLLTTLILYHNKRNKQWFSRNCNTRRNDRKLSIYVNSTVDICDCACSIKYIPLALFQYACGGGKSPIKVLRTKSVLFVEYTVQFILWTKTKFSNLSVSDVAKISKSFLKSVALFIWVWVYT